MTDGNKRALIVAAGIVAAVALYIYFSPYQSCVRAMEGDGAAQSLAASVCSKNSN